MGVGPADRVVLCASRFSERKGQHVLLHAWESCSEPGEVLVLCGSGHSAEDGFLERIRGMAEHWSGAGRVAVLESGVSRHEMKHCLAASDIAVQPSFYEGLGYSALEAMAAGVPCVLTDVDGFDTFARHGENAYVVPAENPALLAIGLRKMLDDGEFATSLLESAHDVANAYSIELNAQVLLEAVGFVQRSKGCLDGDETNA